MNIGSKSLKETTKFSATNIGELGGSFKGSIASSSRGHSKKSLIK